MGHSTAAGALPDAFLDRLARILSLEQFDRVLASFAAPQATGARVNTLRADAETVLAELRTAGLHPEPVEGIPDALTVAPDEREALLASPAYAEGRLYVQNLASQLPPLLLAPEPGERVLDLCAAPGSKTRQLACLMKNDGEIAAVEVSRGRYFKLRANVEAQGSGIVRFFHRDGSTVWHHRPEHFDRVLLDAPCSTEGRFRLDDPDSTRFWQPRKPREMARKQGRLLFSAVQSLAVGGTLVYSTCTFAPEENEGALDRLLRTFGDAIEVAPLELPPIFEAMRPLTEWERTTFDPRIGEARRLLPTARSEGFFVAKLVKHTSTLDPAP